MDSLETRVGTIETDVAFLKEKGLVIDVRQQTLYEQTAKLKEYHIEVMARFDQLATKEDLDYMDKKIGEHDREIFKLKNRA